MFGPPASVFFLIFAFDLFRVKLRPHGTKKYVPNSKLITAPCKSRLDETNKLFFSCLFNQKHQTLRNFFSSNASVTQRHFPAASHCAAQAAPLAERGQISNYFASWKLNGACRVCNRGFIYFG